MPRSAAAETTTTRFSVPEDWLFLLGFRSCFFRSLDLVYVFGFVIYFFWVLFVIVIFVIKCEKEE